MFVSSQRPSRSRWNLSLIGSVAVHGVVLWVICLRPTPIFVTPSQIANGNRGASAVLYFTPPGNQQTLVAERSKHAPAQLYLPVKQKTRFNAKITNEKNVQPQNPEPASSASAGSPNSSDLYGETTGADVRPAIELSNVDPPIARSDIPPGIEGYVKVEVSIDEQGKVIGTKLITGLGHGIDEKVIATIQNYWHYRPATRDGVPIPSKYDARWYYHG
ncbi:MAG TPA: energy transducer TonB [Candidatus Angelobacter sp.]|nr:energy transducer TonB [Candidatus Angelobacter sp.]